MIDFILGLALILTGLVNLYFFRYSNSESGSSLTNAIFFLLLGIGLFLSIYF